VKLSEVLPSLCDTEVDGTIHLTSFTRLPQFKKTHMHFSFPLSSLFWLVLLIYSRHNGLLLQ